MGGTPNKSKAGRTLRNVKGGDGKQKNSLRGVFCYEYFIKMNT
jgi:hypothetical protein